MSIFDHQLSLKINCFHFLSNFDVLWLKFEIGVESENWLYWTSFSSPLVSSEEDVAFFEVFFRDHLERECRFSFIAVRIEIIVQSLQFFIRVYVCVFETMKLIVSNFDREQWKYNSCPNTLSKQNVYNLIQIRTKERRRERENDSIESHC